jgi:hypothetical protein
MSSESLSGMPRSLTKQEARRWSARLWRPESTFFCSWKCSIEISIWLLQIASYGKITCSCAKWCEQRSCFKEILVIRLVTLVDVDCKLAVQLWLYGPDQPCAGELWSWWIISPVCWCTFKLWGDWTCNGDPVLYCKWFLVTFDKAGSCSLKAVRYSERR